MKRFSIASAFGVTLLVAIAMVPELAFRMPNLVLPAPGEIKLIEFEDKAGNVTSITDPKIVEQCLDLVKDQNIGWKSTWHTFPTPSHSIRFYGEDKQFILVIWLGNGWIGARDEHDGNRLHAIDSYSHGELLSIVSRQ